MANARQPMNHIHFLIDYNGVCNSVRSLNFLYSFTMWIISRRLWEVPRNLLYFFRKASQICGSIDALKCNRQALIPYSSVRNSKQPFSPFLGIRHVALMDTFLSFFFCGCWSFIGGKVIEAMMEFFKSRKLLKQWNSNKLGSHSKDHKCV